MKKFLIKCAAFMLTLILPFAAYFAYIQAKPAVYRDSLMGSMLHKQQLLTNTDGARIIIVGGSGAPYAVISDEMQAAFDMPCINIGATAYLGLEFYFSQLKGNIHEGDIIIIAPEYSMYENAIDYNTVWAAVENNYDVMKKLPLSYVPPMAKSFYKYSRDKLDILKTIDPTTTTYEQEYENAGFGYWGDIIIPRESMLESKYNTLDMHSVDADTIIDEITNSINSFNKYASRHGAKVYMTYATFDRLALTCPLENVDALQASIQSKCDIPWLGELRSGVMDENLFYNTNNHLTSEGAEIRTAALISDLKTALQ